MKKLTAIIALTCLATLSYGQKADVLSMTPDEVEILKTKAKNQRTAAIAMVSAGTAMILIGSAVVVESDATSEGGGIAILAGSLLNIASIPFTVCSHINRKKAKKMSLSVAPTTSKLLLPGGSIQNKLVTGVSITIPLGR